MVNNEIFSRKFPSKFKLFSIFVVVFLIIYGPVVDSGGSPFFDISTLICMFCMILYFLTHKNIRVDGLLLSISIFLLLIIIITMLNIIVLDLDNLENTHRALLRPIRVFIVLFGIAAFARMFAETYKSEAANMLIIIVYSCIFLHGCIMILQFFFVDFRSLIYSYTEAKHVIEIYQSTRMAGLSGAGGAQLSIVQSIGLIIGIYLFVTEKSILAKLLIAICGIAIFVSVILAGRSGLITAVIICPIYYFYLNYREKNYYFVKNTILIIFITLLAFFFATFFLLDYLLENIYFLSLFNRIFDSFINYNNTGEFKINTLMALSNMIIFPNEIMHLVIGKASYLNNNTTYSINTDIGYMRLIWGYGLLGSIFHYLFYIASIYFLVKHLPRNNVMSSLPILVILVILFFNIKEILIFSKMSFQITALIMFIVYYHANSRYRHISTAKND